MKSPLHPSNAEKLSNLCVAFRSPFPKVLGLEAALSSSSILTGMAAHAAGLGG